MTMPSFPCGLSFPGKHRAFFTVYTIVSHDFNAESHTTFYCYSAPSSEISMVGGASCFRVTREQLNYALRQARENGYTIRRRVSTDDVNVSRTHEWNAHN